MRKKFGMALVSMLAAGALVFGAAAPAQALAGNKYSYCPIWMKSWITVRSSQPFIAVSAYDPITNAYLGRATSNRGRLDMSGGQANVRFSWYMDGQVREITTFCV